MTVVEHKFSTMNVSLLRVKDAALRTLNFKPNTVIYKSQPAKKQHTI